MPLIALSAGWEDDPDTGKREFIIRLAAEKPEDVPDFNALDVWNRTPLRLTRCKLERQTEEERSDDERPLQAQAPA